LAKSAERSTVAGAARASPAREVTVAREERSIVAGAKWVEMLL